jgi:uncharacterized membrane protein
MANRFPVLLSTLIAVVSTSVFAQNSTKVSSDIRTVNGVQHVVLENRHVRLTFDPARGGRCSKFLFKDNGEQIIGDEDVSGMFLDHWSKFAWPSGLMHLPYKHELVRDGENQVGVRLWIEVPKSGGGKGERDAAVSLKIATSPELVGLTVQKTVWLRADSDVIRVEQAIINSTDESRAAGLYIQQNLGMGGTHHSDNWYLPSTRGIEVHVQADKPGGQSVGPDFIPDPVDGWLAVKDRKSDRGLLFVFDYNYLAKTYTSGGTGEWFMESVPIGPGKSFRTEYFVKPVRGFKDFAYSSKRLVADIQADETQDGEVRVSHDIAAVAADLNNVTVELRLTGWKSKQRLVAKSFRIDRLKNAKQRQQFSFSPKALSDGVVIAAVVRSGAKEDRYEYFYAGDKAERERRSVSFVTKGRAVASSRGDAYFRKQPRKRKSFDKPDFAKVARPDPKRYRCLVVFGLFTHILNLDDAVADRKRRGLTPVEFDWANCPPNAVETFPGTYDELFRYDLVVLSDVNYKALGDIAMEMVCDYVHEGGSLLVVGGPYAYGNGEFDGSRFFDVLPVHVSGPFDLKWAGKGKSWQLKATSPDHRVLRDISFDQKSCVFWHHFLTPKKDSTVVLKAGDNPVLVFGRYGKGKVAALSLSPTGVGAQGEVPWWDWDGWFPLVRNLFAWAKRKESDVGSR